jgi:ABC-type sugar transport system ATPase subunit
MPAQDSRTEAALTVSRLAGERFTYDGEITIAAGEIVGLTGAPGAGYEEVPYLIAGVSHRGSAKVLVSGKQVPRRGTHESRRQGIGLVPAERLSQGILLQASVRENLSPLVRSQHTRVRLLSRRRELRWAQSVCRTFQIVASHADAPIATLSGGNQQKVLLARVLEDHPKVLLLHEPTEGVDEMTRRDLVSLIRKVASEGTAVLYVSSDIDEVAECSDRVLVVRDGAIAAEFPRGPEIVDSIYAASYLTHERK